MKFEDYLQQLNESGIDQARLAHARKLKVVSAEIERARQLSEWINGHGGLEYVKSHVVAIDLISRFSSDDITGIDIETAKCRDHPMSGLVPSVSKVRTVQLWQMGKPVVVVDCFEAGYEWLNIIQSLKLAAHNSVFEIKHLRNVMLNVPSIACTMLMMRPFAGKNLSLVKTIKMIEDVVDGPNTAAEALGIELGKSLQTSDWGRSDLFLEQIEYAAADAIAAGLLFRALDEVYVSSDVEFARVNDLLQSLVPVVASQAPIYIDLVAHQEILKIWNREVEEARLVLSQSLLTEPTKPAAKQRWLSERLTSDQLLDWPCTPTGKLSTSRDVILANSDYFPELKDLSRFTQFTSFQANFGSKLSDMSVDSQLFPSYRIAGAATGRFGCSEPNLQNIPKSLRHVITAPEGSVFVTGDLSQIELRVAGLIANESVINDAYQRGQDLHKLMGAKMAGVPVNEVTKAYRQAAKAANFGLLYGAGARTLQSYAWTAFGVWMSDDEARASKDAFLEMYPNLAAWQKEIVDVTNARGYSESTYFKLRRYYADDTYTHAMNFPIQSSAWEILACAMLYVHERLPADGTIQISHHVYDELCLVATEQRKEEAALLLRDGFRHGYNRVFPGASTKGLVGIGSGISWFEAASDDVINPEWSL